MATTEIPFLGYTAVRYCATQARNWYLNNNSTRPLQRFASSIWECTPDDDLTEDQSACITALFKAACDAGAATNGRYNQMRAQICAHLGQPEPDFEFEAEKSEAVEAIDEFFEGLIDDDDDEEEEKAA